MKVCVRHLRRLEYNPMDMSMDPNVDLVPAEGKPFLDDGRYHWLVANRTYSYQTGHFFPSECCKSISGFSNWRSFRCCNQVVKYLNSATGSRSDSPTVWGWSSYWTSWMHCDGSTSIGIVYWLEEIWRSLKKQNVVLNQVLKQWGRV